jgi:cytosine/adenosine deaminase-related metal-dependent hydrolase
VGADATNVLDSVVFASIAADVHHVVCSGRVVVRDGVHFSMDMPGELLRSFEAIS